MQDINDIFKYTFSTKSWDNVSAFFRFQLYDRNDVSEPICEVLRWTGVDNTMDRIENVKFRYSDNDFLKIIFTKPDEEKGKPFTWMFHIENGKYILNICGYGGAFPYELTKMPELTRKIYH